VIKIMRSSVLDYASEGDGNSPPGGSWHSNSSQSGDATVPSSSFYQEYHGHTLAHLDALHAAVRRGRSVVWLLGDSTLDNKHWIDERVAACNGYEAVLKPSKSRPDVAHWLNSEMVARGLDQRMVAINTAVEEATLGARHGGTLLEQDTFCRDHLQANDELVCSCGGNDIALRPTVGTGLSMVSLLSMPTWLIRHAGSSPVFYHLVPGLGHFVHLFGCEARKFIERVCVRTQPKVVVLCMLYYLDEMAGGSWADHTLSFLGYNTNPEKLQLIMRIIFERAISQVHIPGTTVVPVPLYEVLDGKDTNDYVARVEPSSQGGQKMAKLLMERLLAKMPVAAPDL